MKKKKGMAVGGMKKKKKGMAVGGAKMKKKGMAVGGMKKKGMAVGGMKKKGMSVGGLKKPPNKGAASLPKKVRNQMGFMYGGGMTAKKKGFAPGGAVKKKGKAKGGARGGRSFSHLIQSKRG